VRSDLVVVGAGAAGLFAALTAAREGARVTLVSARPLAETASYWAQGGAAAALAVDDSPDLHLQDTLAAGRGLTRHAAADVLAQEAAARVADLQRLGVKFDADRRGDLALGLEGGHSRRRVVHAGGSATGRRILRALSAAAVEEPRIEILEGRRAAGLLGGGGAILAAAGESHPEGGRRAGVSRPGDGRGAGTSRPGDDRGAGTSRPGDDRGAGTSRPEAGASPRGSAGDGERIAARATILATGGAAALWSRTTNPPGSFGSGLLLARAAGAQLADLEFTQFHPTAVVGIKGREGFLISEAVRGEGATLHGPDGERFVDELAPRDHVARAIFNLPGQAAELDMTQIDPARFPNIVQALREAGLDPTIARVPVAPASHYVMGGIVTDLHGRASGAPRLYAVGECACTGLHGANRLASNSLSECFVYGRRAALEALDEPPPAEARTISAQIQPPTPQTRAAVWRHAGLERTAVGLEELSHDPYPLARLVAACALAREETRGAHARAEFPQPDPALDGHHTVLDATSEVPRFEAWLLPTPPS
jgi:L-aspartate oxidase